MDPWLWAVALKPFGLLLMFAPGALLVRYIKYNMPDSKLRRFLLISWKV